MIEAQIRRPCSEPETFAVWRQGIEGVQCGECKAYSLRKDRFIEHEPVTEWISMDELRDLLNGEGKPHA